MSAGLPSSSSLLSSCHLLHEIYFLMSSFCFLLFGVLFSFSSLTTFLLVGVVGRILFFLLTAASVSSSSSCALPTVWSSSLCFFLLGWLFSLLLLASALIFALAFFLTLIFSSMDASFSNSILSSSLHLFSSFSPSLVVNLGKAHLLYSDLSFIII